MRLALIDREEKQIRFCLEIRIELFPGEIGQRVSEKVMYITSVIVPGGKSGVTMVKSKRGLIS